MATEHLTKETFTEKVFNFEQNQDWKFEGKLPCIIDFYADQVLYMPPPQFALT